MTNPFADGSMKCCRSNPTSPNYGKHLTASEVIQLFAPRNESVEAVRDWLVSAGIPAGMISQSRNKQVRKKTKTSSCSTFPAK